MDVKTTIILGILVGVLGTGLGGLLTFFIKSGSKQMSNILGFSGGIMLVAVFMELVPEAIGVAGLTYTTLGILVGIGFLFALDVMMNIIMPHNACEDRNYFRTAILLFIAMASHNFPEGMAIGSGFEASTRIGILLVVTLGIHNVPEGMAVATSFRMSGMSRTHAMISTLLAGTPMVLGTLTGTILGKLSAQWIAISMGFAAGAMIYTVSHEILPEACTRERSSPWGIVWGFVAGSILFNLF